MDQAILMKETKRFGQRDGVGQAGLSFQSALVGNQPFQGLGLVVALGTAIPVIHHRIRQLHQIIKKLRLPSQAVNGQQLFVRSGDFRVVMQALPLLVGEKPGSRLDGNDFCRLMLSSQILCEPHLTKSPLADFLTQRHILDVIPRDHAFSIQLRPSTMEPLGGFMQCK